MTFWAVVFQPEVSSVPPPAPQLTPGVSEEETATGPATRRKACPVLWAGKQRGLFHFSLECWQDKPEEPGAPDARCGPNPGSELRKRIWRPPSGTPHLSDLARSPSAVKDRRTSILSHSLLSTGPLFWRGARRACGGGSSSEPGSGSSSASLSPRNRTAIQGDPG